MSAEFAPSLAAPYSPADVRRIAQEAGLLRYDPFGMPEEPWSFIAASVARFAAIVRREALAEAEQECRDIADGWGDGTVGYECADAIRLLSTAEKG